MGDKHIILDQDESDVHDSDSPGVRQTRIVEANIVAGDLPDCRASICPSSICLSFLILKCVLNSSQVCMM